MDCPRVYGGPLGGAAAAGISEAVRDEAWGTRRGNGEFLSLQVACCPYALLPCFSLPFFLLFFFSHVPRRACCVLLLPLLVFRIFSCRLALSVPPPPLTCRQHHISPPSPDTEPHERERLHGERRRFEPNATLGGAPRYRGARSPSPGPGCARYDGAGGDVGRGELHLTVFYFISGLSDFFSPPFSL